MSNMRNDCQSHRGFIQTFRRRRSSNSSAVLATSMFSYPRFSPGRTVGKEIPDSFRELSNIISIEFRLSFSFSFSPACSCIRVSQTFGFGCVQRSLFDQKSLPLIPPARTTELQNHRRQHGMLFRSSGQRSIAGGKKNEIVQIGASQTQRALVLFQSNPSLPPQLLAAFITLRITMRDEYFQTIGLLRGCF